MRKSFLSLVAVALLVSACVGGRRPPDEMTVVDGPPLSLPPDFELRPPRDGEDSQAAQRRTRDVLFEGQTTQGASSPTESWLIRKAGGENRDPNIREKLEEEAARAESEEQKSWLEKQKEALLGTKDEEPAE